MISDRFRVKVRVEGGEGAKEAMPVSGAEERTHIIIFARRRARELRWKMYDVRWMMEDGRWDCFSAACLG